MKKTPENDYQPNDPQLRLPDELLPTPVDNSVEPVDVEEKTEPTESVSPFQPPESVKAQVEALERERSAEWDRIDKQGQTTSRATRQRAGIEVIDEELLAAQATKKALASKPKQKRRATRRGLGPRQLLNADGPPPGVEDVRRQTY